MTTMAEIVRYQNLLNKLIKCLLLFWYCVVKHPKKKFTNFKD